MPEDHSVATAHGYLILSLRFHNKTNTWLCTAARLAHCDSVHTYRKATTCRAPRRERAALGRAGAMAGAAGRRALADSVAERGARSVALERNMVWGVGTQQAYWLKNVAKKT